MASTTSTSTGARRAARLQALLIPADPAALASLVDVDDAAASIAAAIGAHLIDDALTCHLPAGPGPRRATLYRPGGDAADSLCVNGRAAGLLTELGAAPVELRGDVLVLGLGDRAEQDLPVPAQVLAAASRLDLLR